MKFLEWLRSLFTSKPAAPLPPLKGPDPKPAAPAWEQKAQPVPAHVPSVTPTDTVPPPLSSPSSVLIKGIDVAKYQDGIKWAEVYSEGFRFMFPKATDGASGLDAFCPSFKRDAKANGILVGAGYCFNRFKADPIAQAAHLCLVTGGVMIGELPLILDCEWDNSAEGFPQYKDGGELDDAGADHLFSCLNEIERLSKVTPWVYTSKSFWGDKIKNPERFSRFPLWLNDFHAKTVADLRIPAPWKRPVVWQYKEAPLAGVSGVDLNYFLGSIEELKAMARK